MDWNGLVNEYGTKLLLYARQWTGSLADAEDAVQDGFIRFWRSADARLEDPAPFLYALVKRSAIDLYRSRTRRRERELKAAGPPSEAVTMFEAKLEHDERRSEIERAMAGLPEEQREVLVMKIWGELTFDQIGRALDIPMNTAASRYRYAVEAMRGRLNKGEL